MNKKILFVSFSLLMPAMSMAGIMGTPFASHVLPGTVEAEDYDKGGEGVAFHWRDTKSGNYRAYRTDPICISRSSVDGSIVLGNISNGDWTNYTVSVSQAGDYEVRTLCSSGLSSGGTFVLKIDGEDACRTQYVPNTGWNTYDYVATGSVHLTKGEHVFQFYTYGGMNVDKFVFTRTGELSGDGSQGDFHQYKWPMTQRYEHNPLFVAFPSQQYQSNWTGTLYTADPSAHVWNINGEEVLYLYPSHDQEPPQGCGRMDKYHVFSTTNMLDWTDHGEILSSDQVEWGRPSGGMMWAPDCAYKNGTYYFYFPHPSGDDNWNKTWKIGIATSRYPDRDFKLQGYIHNIDSVAMIDPSVFVDDDGEAYFYYGGGGRCLAARLKADMLDIAEPLREMAGLHDFHEAAWVFKHNGVYYLTYSDNHPTNLGGNNLCYATSKSPLGPWEYQGVYMRPHGFDTAHGSVVKYKGKWYQFYHTGNFGNRGNLRSVCVDELTFSPDGKICVVNTWGTPHNGVMPNVSREKSLVIEAEKYNDGGSHKGFYKRPTTTEFIYNDQRTGEMQTATEGATAYLKSMTAAEWVRYSFNVKTAGKYTIRVRQRQVGSKQPQIRVGVDGYWTGKDAIDVKTGEAQWGYTEISNVELTAGEHYMEWRCMAGTLDVDAIEIVPDGVTAIASVTSAGAQSSKWYTLQGTVADSSHKGITICNNRKFIVK